MIEIEKGKYGKKINLRGPLTQKSVDEINASGVKELELNYARGWIASDLGLLQKLTDLSCFWITDYSIEDLAPLHCLHNLRSLSVVTTGRSEIHFSSFPKLESFSIDYSDQKLVGLFDCITLTNLFMNCFKGRDSEPFGRLVNLERLRLLSPSLGEIKGFRHLKKVKELRLALARRLDSLEGLEGMAALEDLMLQSIPNVKSIDEVGHLENLKDLYISGSGEIESLRCLEGVPNFARFAMDDKVIADGDFSVFTRLEHLEFLGYVDKKHYNPRKKELKALLEAKFSGAIEVS